MRPYTTARGLDVALVELRRNCIVTGHTGPHDLLDDRPHIGGKPPRIGAGGLPAELGDLGDVRIAQALPALLGGRQGGLGALRDHLALVLVHRREDVDGQLVGVRVVNSHELDAGVRQRGNEGQVAAQPVELGDDELGLVLLAGRERLLQFRPVIALAALDLGEVVDKRPPATIEIILNSLALRVEA